MYKRQKDNGVFEGLVYDVDYNQDMSTGLDFALEDSKAYRILMTNMRSSSGSTQSLMRLNGDTTIGNYENQLFRGVSTAPAAGTFSGSAWNIGFSNDLYPGTTDILLFAKNDGAYRCALSKSGLFFPSLYYYDLYAHWWENNTDPLTSINIRAGASDSISGNIKIYEIDLP